MTTASTTKDKHQIKLLTFNTWGLKFVSKHRSLRLHAIADTLAGKTVAKPLPELEPFISQLDTDYDNFDIIALQEIWVEADWEYIVKTCKKKYPYTRLYSSGIISGPGLALLSRIPFTQTNLYRFPINGTPVAVNRGDWYVGKSIAIATFTLNDGNRIALFNSHMHAPYSLIGPEAYIAHRSVQAWDFSRLVKLYKDAGYSPIVVGDLNSRPGSLPHTLLTNIGLVDSWETFRGKKDNLAHLAQIDPAQQIVQGCTTCDTTLNTWREMVCEPNEAQRLDYALIDQKFKVSKASACFTERIDNMSFSDHFGYTCTLTLREDAVPSNNNSESHFAVCKELLELIQEHIDICETRDFWLQFLAVFIFTLFIVTVIWGIVLNKQMNTGLGVVLGVLFTLSFAYCSLVGLVFGRSERRAFEEVRREVNDELDSIL